MTYSRVTVGVRENNNRVEFKVHKLLLKKKKHNFDYVRENILSSTKRESSVKAFFTLRCEVLTWYIRRPRTEHGTRVRAP